MQFSKIFAAGKGTMWPENLATSFSVNFQELLSEHNFIIKPNSRLYTKERRRLSRPYKPN